VAFAEAAAYEDTFAKILTQFRARFPGVQLELMTRRSVEQWKDLRERRLNVGFAYFLPSEFPELRSQLVTRAPVVLVVPKRHLLARKPNVFLRDLHNEPFLWVRRDVSSLYYESIADACRAGGLKMKIVQTVPTEAMMLSFVMRGTGLCFGVESRVHRHKLPNVVVRRVEDLKVTADLLAIWRVDDDAPPLKMFVSLIETCRKSEVNGSRSEPVKRRASSQSRLP